MGKKRRREEKLAKQLAKQLAKDERRIGSPIPESLRPRPALAYELNEGRENVALSALRRATPGLNYLLTRYPRGLLRRDAVAGVAVAAYLIPQVMAYSAIVNVPPVASLWTALAAIIAYAVLGLSLIHI